MVGFSSDEQRKAVMSQLNPGSGVLTTMIGSPVSTSIPAKPQKEKNSILKYVNDVFDRREEGKKIKANNKDLEKKKEQEDAKIIEQKRKYVEHLQNQIRDLQSGKMTDSEREKAIGTILKKERGALPKEVEEKLKLQQAELIKGRTSPIMPDGISPADKKIVAEANSNLESGISRKAFEQRALLKDANDESLSKHERDFVKQFNKDASNIPMVQEETAFHNVPDKMFEEQSNSKPYKHDVDLEIDAAQAAGV